ncbi:VanZ family protein [Arthrobacter livingstonensis]|uniref:VanZ family protein n=1 Tax=Arthrobacter livingstonensis TaxID=670078 RepID=A0A2V5LX79_9MICC|nr:VanZ family protein [Arthrobacter livingstonensis]PYI68347.1 VanZ family protein [Arthrobacter livingstonensis]
MKPSRHHVTMVLAVLYFMALAAMVFWPSPVDRPVDGALMQVIAWLHSHGLPQWFIGYRKVEFAANILLFVPFGFIIAVRLHRIYWWVAVAAAAVVSGLIELTQAMLLPERVPAWSDIVANTSGALIGAVLVLTLRAVFTRSNKRADARQ